MRRIEKLRKLSIHNMALLLEMVADPPIDKECPVCCGCAKAKQRGWDCVKAREEYLKGIVDDENGLEI